MAKTQRVAKLQARKTMSELTNSNAASLKMANAADPESDHSRSIARGGVACPFNWRLHDMLDAVENEDLTSIVSWQPHGRSFTVYKPKEFVDKVMTRFFSQSKYASFQRQLNLYGFSRLSHGPDKGAYFHYCFVRGDREKVRGMVRRKIKGNKVRRALTVEEEPDFYDSVWHRAEHRGLAPIASISPEPPCLETTTSPSTKPEKPVLLPKPANTWEAFEEVNDDDLMLFAGTSKLLDDDLLLDNVLLGSPYVQGSRYAEGVINRVTSSTTLSLDYLCSV